jgi:hypothetical protein
MWIPDIDESPVLRSMIGALSAQAKRKVDW